MATPADRQVRRKSAMNRSHPWYHLRHPFRLFYLLVAAVVGATVLNSVANLLSSAGKPDTSLDPVSSFQRTIIWIWATGNPQSFWPIAAGIVIAAGIGWWFDAHPGNEDPTHIPLPFARDLRAVGFKMGDDVAAGMPFIVSPIQEVYLRAVDILHDAATRAPSAKNGLIVLGVANAGKTRLAFEVTKKVLPNWRVLIWRPDDPQPSIAQLEDQDVVIFVDDLQEHAPTEVRYSRGAVQSLDTRSLELRKMEQLVRSYARQVILIATCRSEDELRVRARLGWLFAELETVMVPLFPIQGPEAEQVIHEFQQQALKRMNDWDGTIGSLVLGLSAKRQSYAELAADHDPAVRVLQAMKLLSLAGIETHTTQRLRIICAQVFRHSDLATEEAWQEAVRELIDRQFVTESFNGEALIIRKDTYFERVITDYPSPNRPQQLERDLEKAMMAMMAVPDVEAVFYLSNALYRQKQYEPSLSGYNFVLDSADRAAPVATAVIWRNKGAVLQSLHRYDAALAAYDQAIALDGNYSSAWRNRAGVLDEMGHYDDALVAYNHALAIEPTYAQAWNGKGKTLSRLNNFPEAVDAFEKAIEIDPNYEFAWRNLGDARSSLGLREVALAAYDEALRINSTYVYALNGKGVVLRELGQLDPALKAFDRVIQLDPKMYYAYNGRGATLRDMGRLDEALDALNHCVAMSPEYPSAWKNKGTVFNALKRYDEAIQAFDRALSFNDKYCPAWTGRGIALVAKKQYGDALSDFDRALSIDDKYRDALKGKIDALRGLGRNPEAKEVERVLASLNTIGQRPDPPDTPDDKQNPEDLVPEPARQHSEQKESA